MLSSLPAQWMKEKDFKKTAARSEYDGTGEIHRGYGESPCPGQAVVQLQKK